MKKCPYCAEMIEDEAIKCKYCGEFMEGRSRFFQGAGYWGYEYKSKRRLFGLPLIHIAQGIDPQTGRPRVAKGIIAIGNIAKGLIAIGGIAMGGISIGGLTIGLLGLGGLSIGIIALGGVALSIFLSIGGLAVSFNYAIGGLAIAPHAIGGNRVDQDFLRQVEKWWTTLGPRDPAPPPVK